MARTLRRRTIAVYEVHDTANYITPDVVVDFTSAVIEQVAADRVRLSRVGGKPRTPTLKMSIACAEGFIGGEVFFMQDRVRCAGPGSPGGLSKNDFA